MDEAKPYNGEVKCSAVRTALGGISPRWFFCDDSFQDILLLAVNESFL